MKYILTCTRKNRKNARRHIIARGDDVKNLEQYAHPNKWYNYEIYTGGWKLVKEVINAE